MEIRWGSRIAVWNRRRDSLFLISLSITAIVTANTVSKTMNAELYRSVFLVMMKASLVLNRNLKLVNPTQGLPQMPCK
ncbi:hypothetical protein D3C75_854040 [compost metagenome]